MSVIIVYRFSNYITPRVDIISATAIKGVLSLFGEKWLSGDWATVLTTLNK